MAYDCLSDKRYVHSRVNHSLTITDPETGAHTNSEEGTWSAIKRGLHTTHVDGQFDSYVAKYTWRYANGHKMVEANWELYQENTSGKKQWSAFDQVSEFDRRRIVAYRDCGLSFREIVSRVGRNQTTVMRICDRWMQEGTTDRRGQ
ncbi:transposable element Tcb1 transposase [Trichonephila clavipes]|nr:transposable element Tcb1 transposase [Trichonephila clavipes]